MNQTVLLILGCALTAYQVWEVTIGIRRGRIGVGAYNQSSKASAPQMYWIFLVLNVAILALMTAVSVELAREVFSR